MSIVPIRVIISILIFLLVSILVFLSLQSEYNIRACINAGYSGTTSVFKTEYCYKLEDGGKRGTIILVSELDEGE